MDASAGVDWGITGSTIVVDMSNVPPADLPGSIFIESTYTGTQSYDMEGVISTFFSYTNPGSVTSLFSFSNTIGTLSVVSTADIRFDNAIGSLSGGISGGAIQASAGAPGFGPEGDIGSAVTVQQSGALVVQGNGGVLNYGTPLLPDGFRMANLSAISALSYGSQGDGSNTHAGGPVSVTTATNSSITISNTGTSAVTAGISAASASGPGNTNGNYFAGWVFTGSAVSVNSYGTITNSADAGLGIMATITGGQFLASGTNVASNGGVLVNLFASSTITLTGLNSLGVFAVSEVYTTSDPKKDTSVQAGPVNFNSQAGSLISTGSSGSTLSIGVLAVSAGTDLLLNPFSSQTVNGHGNGAGGAVTVSSTGNIQTQGTMSAGIAAMSLGGAGISTTNTGTAGDNAVLGNTGAASDSNGSNGDAVTVTNAGAITTIGTSAYGIVALSSGGGGLINNLLASTGSTGLVVGNDTSGGSASNGGNVLVQNNGSIVTGDLLGGGETSIGIVAQSIGGAGGNAGGQHAALFVGDKGGAGGKGGSVTVNTGVGSSIITRDDNSIGILAESIGGGGGNGANADGIFVALGGKGGAGGNGGTVSVNVGGTIATLGDYSGAVVAHSIGGGGGNGGGAKSIGLGADIGIGGKGGGGGSGGAVSANVAAGARVSTVGNLSNGLHLQSIGGGGGSGGAAISEVGAVGTGEGVTLSFALALGGSGNNGGTGGSVSGTNAGTIVTGVAFTGTEADAGLLGADSVGMMAQSIGGGGGSGGSAASKSLAFTTGTGSYGSFKYDLSMGGDGANGGNGGAVSLNNLNSLTTWGDGAYGMLAQSVGGGGGYGGDSTAASTFTGKAGANVALTMAFGGTAGAGGTGGGVFLSNSGPTARIVTHGQSAVGMLAQSIGGGGGAGGLGNAKLHTPSSGSSTALVFGITVGAAGSGGSGGEAGGVEAVNEGTINTDGSGAQGILAQAIGGGGGNAGGGSAAGSNNKITVNLALGNTGGAGGSASGTNSFGESVTVTNSGTIATLAGSAAAIVAQSIGGGGGTGGTADAEASIGPIGSLTNLLFSSTGYSSNITLGAALGGDGGGGGAGGAVSVAQNSTVTTQGFQSYGILAQSISGGGGLGGSATASSNPGLFDGYDGTIQYSAQLALGGQGGDASNGRSVTVSQTGTTTTAGYGAHAIVAQSVAGGGGIGADGSADITSTIGLGLGINNVTGGSQAIGGTVIVNQTGLISTAAGDATGILAQSISGGGGIGSTGNALKFTGSFGVGILPVHLDMTLGIDLKTTFTADGGAVTVTSGSAGQSAAISTAGDFSHGIVAQSIGGGGGKASSIFGANSGAYADFSDTYTYVSGTTSTVSSKWIKLGAAEGKGAGGAATVNLVNSVITTGSGASGYAAYGVLVQSIGGGGGLATVNSAAANGTIVLGGSGTASGGNGGTVNLNEGGTVTTYGESAHGVVLQSVGGGGGVAAVGSSSAFSGSAPSGLAVNTVAGSQDSWGAGNVVNYSAAVNITTSGNQAFGLVAQSIGGGGGIVTAQQSGTSTLGMGGATGDYASYSGSTVILNVEGGSTITTTGIGSHGIVAQSIGGGGGIADPGSDSALSTTSLAQSNAGTALGYGGDVNVLISNDVFTSGAGAYGVIAQTISGGGGLTGSFAGSTGGAHSSGSVQENTGAGTTTVTQGAGLIAASGSGATAIFAQNVTSGTHGMGNVFVSVGGTVTGGSGSNAYGVWVDGGNTGNTLTIQSSGVISAASKAAINYTGVTHLNVTNSGTVLGSVSLASGTFNNLNTWATEGVNNAVVTDNGVLVIGLDSNTAATATFTGAYTQGNSLDLQYPTIFMDVFSNTSYDQMLFSGSGHGTFNWMLTVKFAASYQPEVGDVFTLIGGAAGNSYDEFFLDEVHALGLAPGVNFDTFINPNGSFNLEITAVPEPASLALLALGLGALIFARRRLHPARP